DQRTFWKVYGTDAEPLKIGNMVVTLQKPNHQAGSEHQNEPLKIGNMVVTLQKPNHQPGSEHQNGARVMGSKAA
nr:hypothetical protein [Tanacetum cinerariifolium]